MCAFTDDWCQVLSTPVHLGRQQQKAHRALAPSLFPAILHLIEGGKKENECAVIVCKFLCLSQELVEHPFWKAKLPVLPLPAEPALEAFIKQHNLAPAQGDDLAANQVMFVSFSRSQITSSTPLLLLFAY
jgi:hypothetical protein